MKLTGDDLEWLDRIGVDSKRMKIIKQDQKLRELLEKRIEEVNNLNIEIKKDQLWSWRAVADELEKLLKGSK